DDTEKRRDEERDERDGRDMREQVCPHRFCYLRATSVTPCLRGSTSPYPFDWSITWVATASSARPKTSPNCSTKTATTASRSGAPPSARAMLVMARPGWPQGLM